jgi:beta-barrel assembly-enhancing protease
MTSLVKNKIISLILGVIVFSLGFFQAAPDVFALSIEEEEKLSEDFLRNIKRQYEIVDDDFAQDYINRLGQYLTRSLETKHFPYNFHIIVSSELNAFAGPAGHIFIFTGLIDTMDEIDELAAVICHEIGHVTSRHISERIEQNKKIGLATLAGILAGSMLGGEVADTVITGSVAAGIQKQLNYSRDDERQADQLAVKYMDQAGLDPAGMVRALSKLQRGSLSGSGNVPSYLLTHPTSPERMADIESMLSSRRFTETKKEAEAFRKEYPIFRTLLKSRYSDSNIAEKGFELELKSNTESPLAHFGLGIVLNEKGEYTEALKHLQISSEKLPDSIPVLHYLGETYQLIGNDREAIKIFEEALKIDEFNKSILFSLAFSYQNLEEYSRAVTILESLASVNPVKNEVYYNLGVSLGRMDRLGPAHYYFGLYFKNLGERQKAAFHFQKAREYAGSDASLRERIDKATGNSRM